METNISTPLQPLGKDTYINVLESSGFTVDGDTFSIDIPGVINLRVPVDILLDPEGTEITELHNVINEYFGDDIELFEEEFRAEELSALVELRGERRRTIGRFYSHSKIEWQGIHSRVVKYYKYVELRAPLSMSSVDWEKLLAFLLCVAGIIGIIVLFGLIPAGGISAAGLAVLVPAVAGSCVLAVNSVSTDSKKSARAVVYTGR
jgi:hypothetical protein